MDEVDFVDELVGLGDEEVVVLRGGEGGLVGVEEFDFEFMDVGSLFRG